MEFEKLLKKCSDYNKETGTKRFAYNKELGVMFIGTDPEAYPFKASNYSKAEKVINEYAMFKDKKDCLGDELFYKGYKWNELTLMQQDSIINPQVEYAAKNNVAICHPELYAARFENNQMFLEF